MKIEMGYGDETKGTAETQGDTITYGGQSPAYVESIVTFYAINTEKKGGDLLKYVITRLTGRTWAKEV